MVKHCLMIFTGLLIGLTSGFGLSQDMVHMTVDSLILAQKLDDAEKVARDAIKKYPDHPQVMCALACVYRNRAIRSAIRVNTDAMGIKDGENGTYTIQDSSDFEQLFQDENYYDEAQYAKAESLYYRIIAKHPSYHNAYFNLLNDYVTMKRFVPYFKVIDLFIGNLHDDPDTPHYVLDLAMKLYNAEYWDEALRLYERLLQAYPDFSQAKCNIGAVYVNLGKIDKAHEVFADVYKIAPLDLLNLNNYFLTSILTEDFPLAYELIVDLIRKDDQDYSHFYDAALLAYLIGKNYHAFLNIYLPQRKEHVEQPDDDFWYWTAKQLAHVDTMTQEETLEFFDYLMIQFNQADMKRQALIAAAIIDQSESTNASLLVRCGIYDQFKYVDKTLSYLGKIKARAAIDSTIMTPRDLTYNYGRIYYVAQNADSAIAYFSKYSTERSDNAFVNYALGESYLMKADTSSAIVCFKTNQALEDESQMQYINASIRELKNLGEAAERE
ncbi:tetratricopeptide repeat protein [candidate division KSB1 bacterium]|nr:tetratricopeptide repeat protein [candidate division KSB1 bacterium]